MLCSCSKMLNQYICEESLAPSPWHIQAFVHVNTQTSSAGISLEANCHSATGCFHLRVLGVVNDKWTYVHVQTFRANSLVRLISWAHKQFMHALSVLMSSLHEFAALGAKLRPPDQWWSSSPPESRPPGRWSSNPSDPQDCSRAALILRCWSWAWTEAPLKTQHCSQQRVPRWSPAFKLSVFTWKAACLTPPFKPTLKSVIFGNHQPHRGENSKCGWCFSLK